MYLTYITSCLAGAALGIVSGRIVAELTDHRPYYTIRTQLADDRKLRATWLKNLLNQVEEALVDSRYEFYKERLLQDKQAIKQDIERLNRGDSGFIDINLLHNYTFNTLSLKLDIVPKEQ